MKAHTKLLRGLLNETSLFQRYDVFGGFTPNTGWLSYTQVDVGGALRGIYEFRNSQEIAGRIQLKVNVSPKEACLEYYHSSIIGCYN